MLVGNILVLLPVWSAPSELDRVVRVSGPCTILIMMMVGGVDWWQPGKFFSVSIFGAIQVHFKYKFEAF